MDIQVVSHVKYAGDVKMVLTAEIHMDYPMQSFVGIPLKLTVTGLSFDGVAILAYIKRKAHFCFLSPEDAAAFLSNESEIDKANHPVPGGPADQTAAKRHPGGGLLEHIKVESEIGQKEDGKQVLKNVGKVEKFVLERVRKIFEEELVYPSFWTFLV
jgi:mitochondrial distribution and morphology protein 12